MNYGRTRPLAFSCISYCVISLLIVLSYWPTFSGDFILDDIPLIKDNPLVTQTPSAKYLSQEDGVTKDGDREMSHTGYYRPIINLTYWMDYQLWGLRASGFRFTNVILHLLNCFVLFSLFSLLLHNRPKALFITLIFSVHPIHTEAVSWISSRNNILVSIFCLSSLYCYIQGARKGRYLLILFSALLFGAGLLSKEFALMMIPVMALYHWVLSEQGHPVRTRAAVFAPFALVLAGYLLLRMHAIGSLVPPSNGIALWQRIYYAPYIVMLNLRYVLFPSGLHSFIVGYPGSPVNWKAFAGIGLITSSAFLLWKERDNRSFVFGWIGFLATLFPVLNIVKTSAVTLVSMRWLYFPTAFLLLAFFALLDNILTKRRHSAMIVGGFLIIYLAGYSHVLNSRLWHDEDTFFRQEVVHFDNSFYLGGLAEKLSLKGKVKEAEAFFHKTIDMRPGEARNYINYAGLLLDTARPADALACLARAEGLVLTRHERGQFYNNLGMAFFGLQRKDDALKNFKKATIFAPEEALFWSNLGAAYGSIGDYENSVSVLERGMAVVSDPTPLKKNLAVTYVRMEKFEKAIVILESIPSGEKDDRRTVATLLSQAREGLSLRRKDKTPQREGETLNSRGWSLKVR